MRCNTPQHIGQDVQAASVCVRFVGGLHRCRGTATHCNTITRSNTLPHTLQHVQAASVCVCVVRGLLRCRSCRSWPRWSLQHTAKQYKTLYTPHCIIRVHRNRLQRIETDCITGQELLPFVPAMVSATYCKTLQTLQHTNALHYTLTHCNRLQHGSRITVVRGHNGLCNTLQHTATHCNTLQHTATHCSTLQHTATHECSATHRNKL